MKDACSICKAALDPSRRKGFVADGICPSCLKDLVAQARKPLQIFLDSFGMPILLVDDDARVKLANRQALDFLRKDPSSIEGRYAGDAIECVHAREGGGCGRTAHCKTCTIRRTVVETYESGRPFVRVPAYADIAVFAELKPTRFLISTEKVGGMVMLRIDDVRPGAQFVPEGAPSS
jgi:PAS domain-containing protein